MSTYEASVDRGAIPGLLPETSEALTSGLGNRAARLMFSNVKALVGFLILGLFVVMAVFAPLIAPYDPHAQAFLQTLPPSGTHWLGTTAYGEDIYSQLVWGARETLAIGAVAGLLATILSVIIGVTAAYAGRWVDGILSTITDIFLVIPALPLMIIIAALVPGGSMWVLIGVITITGWSFGARQLRPQAMSLRNREFLEAARVRGERTWYIILCEVLPNMTSLIVAIFLGSALYAIFAAAGLQFIGLGNQNDLSWGTMLFWGDNNEALTSGSPLWIIVPGACIALVGVSVALINYAVDELAHPAIRVRRRKHAR